MGLIMEEPLNSVIEQTKNIKTAKLKFDIEKATSNIELRSTNDDLRS